LPSHSASHPTPVSEIQGALPASLFRTQYLRRHVPVVMRGAVADWPAVNLWAPAYLTSHAGRYPVTLKSTRDYVNGRSIRETEGSRAVTLTAALKTITTSRPPRLAYLRESPVIRESPFLCRDIHVPPFVPSRPMAIPRLLHLPRTEPPLGPLAWIGPANTVAQLHWDPEHNMYAQVRGNKLIILVPPQEVAHTYPNAFSVEELALRSSLATRHPQLLTRLRALARGFRRGSQQRTNSFRVALRDTLTADEVSALLEFLLDTNNCHVDAEHPNLRRHPAFARAQILTTVLDPGDLLFIPYLWRHYVRALSPSISLNWVFRPSPSQADSFSISRDTVVSHVIP